MSKEPLDYKKYREAVQWGEDHGLIQRPGIKYPFRLGIDPGKHLIPFKSRADQ
jgi:hypothetical protein